MPYSSLTNWKNNLEIALSYNPPHISAYALTVEEKTVLYHKVKEKKIDLLDDDDVKQQALEQAQQAYGLFIWFVKWFSYIMITLIVIMFMNNWFDDGTGSMFMPDEIYEDQYDPQGLNKKKGI